jgi:hypothetical protein
VRVLELRVEIKSLTVEHAPEVFEVLARSARNIKKARGLGNPGVNGVANPCRFAGVVLEGIGEIVEVGRLVEHVAKSDNILRPPPDGYAYPHPDFLQVVYVASANSSEGGPEVDWTDTDGYEVTSRLVSVLEARSLTASTDMSAGPFLDVIERTWRGDELAQ